MVLCLGSTCSALHNQGPFKPVCCWQGGRQRWKSSRGTQDGTWPAIEIAQIICTHIVHIAHNKSESGIMGAQLGVPYGHMGCPQFSVQFGYLDVYDLPFCVPNFILQYNVQCTAHGCLCI